MLLIFKIDNFIFNKIFQPISNWLNKNYNISPYKLSFYLCMVLIIFQLQLTAFKININEYDLILFIINIFVILYFIYLSYDAFKKSNEMFITVLNQFRLKYLPIRYFTIILMMPFCLLIIFEDKSICVKTIFIINSIFYVSALYFLCVEFPPTIKLPLEEK